MPDWVSHILFGLIVAEIFFLRPRSLVVLGALLPDVVLKLAHLRIFFPDIPVELWYKLFFGLHSILGGLLVAIVIAPLFHMSMKRFVGLVSVGVVSHILLDGIARVHILNVQGFLLYPLEVINWSLNAVRMEHFYVPMSILFLVWLLVLLARWLVRREVV